MKTTDFATYLNRFLTFYLPHEKGSSPATIDSYRYTFIFFLDYMCIEKNISAERLTIADLTADTVRGFLQWLETNRRNSISTRNQRQAAINSFVHYLAYEYPDYLHEYQKILGIPIKKAPEKEVSYLKTEGVELLVKQIDINKQNGFRDYVMILLLYTTGLRVSELINLKVRDLSLYEPYTLKVRGKGNKTRYIPIMKTSVPHIRKYLSMMNYEGEESLSEFLFLNHMKQPFKRQGINYILKKYGMKSRKKNIQLIPKDLSPHKMRHTTAMELVSQGVDLIYIRDLLGHSSVKVTEIYARTDAKLKRQAIEAASKEIVPPEEAQWDNNEDLKKWLKSLGKA